MPIEKLFSTPPPKQYNKVIATSHYLTMRDGVKIAVDVLLPKDLPTGAKLPVLMIMARYWRSMRLIMPSPPNKAPIGPRDMVVDWLIERGFALVVMDVRGAGASMGHSRHPFSSEEVADYGEVAQWIAQQGWCNGNIGAFGISYEGSTSLLLTSTGVDAVKAVIPQEIEFDVYTDVALPGGIVNAGFIRAWSESNARLDNDKTSNLFPPLARLLVRGVRPVDEDKKSRTMLKQALSDHQANTDVYRAIANITYRDDPFGETGATLDDFSPFIHKDAIQANGSALFSWGGWLDGATADAVIRTYNNFSNPQIAVIGAWKHEMSADGSPYNPPKGKPNPSRKAQWEAMGQFLHQSLAEGNPPQGKTLFYYTLGADTWSQTDTFPLPNTQMQAWYFGADNRLSIDKPTAQDASDRYTVDFTASTGTTSRWHTPMAKPLIYPNRADADKKLFTYTSAPLDADVQITGYATVTLHVASTEADCAFFVYLEDVDEAGYVRYITEGQLRSIHRKISDTPAPYISHLPQHSYLRADALPMPVNEAVEIVIGLQPTSVLVRKGHRIRVAIGGADVGTFARVPAQGTPTWTVYRDIIRASHILLPIVR